MTKETNLLALSEAVSEAIENGATAEEIRIITDYAMDKASVIALDIPEKLHSTLVFAGIRTIGDVRRKGYNGILTIPGVGLTSMTQLIAAFKKIGLTW